MIWVGCERNGSDLFRDMSNHFSGGIEENPKTSVRKCKSPG
jgi:hypothetical protein